MLVGRVEVDRPVEDVVTDPAHTAARLLVTVRGVAVGTVDVPLTRGYAAAATVVEAVRDGLGAAVDRAAPPLPPRSRRSPWWSPPGAARRASRAACAASCARRTRDSR
ncbi:hypothetical protein BJF78_27060 [Pseudonocardia sp. CNS-139]|nr:hypothetical protein BJF78_27060 [Pseudonocardia sp. CNS-139]